ncbi:hypothetical protein EAF04_004708 [Stromatinia cepivora]|nr:hypothetical protein EAF04_004708 [Stromatinia cepivora]
MGMFSGSKSHCNHSQQCRSTPSRNYKIPANPQVRVAPQLTFEEQKKITVYLEGEVLRLERWLEAMNDRNKNWWTDVDELLEGIEKGSTDLQKKEKRS